MKRFGEKLRALRTHRGLSQPKLASMLGYRNFGYISLIETGKSTPTVEFMMKVAQIFGVTLDQLAWDHLDIDSSAGPPDAGA